MHREGGFGKRKQPAPPAEEETLPPANPRLLQSFVVLNARGTRITTTAATLGRLALPSTFFGSFDWVS
eukprot:s2894_g1.t1